MLTTTCTVCRTPVIGHPDDNVCCSWCESANFRGDLLRFPPQAPQPWWLAARGALAPRRRDNGRPFLGTEETP